jgi:magnesium chelatase family protein
MYITGYVPYGNDGMLIRVETDIRRGIPGIDISGLAEGAVKEARERVRAAFRNSGLAFPLDRILINLAPAGVKKEGAALDLPIALSVMAAAGVVPGLAALPEQLMVLGELELSGRVRSVRGVLAAAAEGLSEGIRFFILPKENEEEAAVLLDRMDRGSNGRPAQFAAVTSLDEAAHALVLLLNNGAFPASFRQTPAAGNAPDWGDFADVRGAGRYKRALEIAAAGGHNLLVFGPPGRGKTMLARRIPSIMAPLTVEESVEVSRIHSLAGQGGNFSLILGPPFRSPHHSASAEGILGGGRTIRPGEISLAHFGVLFLDEAPEFKINVLHALREPLEDQTITIVRAEGPVKLPADFQLIMAANACPCGRLGTGIGREGDFSGTGGCFCSPEEIYRYWKKISGSLLDRIELRVPAAENEELYVPGGIAESSTVIQRRVLRAVEIQRRRFGRQEKAKMNREQGGLFSGAFRRNARMDPAQIDTFCHLSREAGRTLGRAAEKLGFSGRAYHGVLRTARTIADLDAKETIGTDHILEAVQHRRFGDDPYEIVGI